VSPIQLPKLIDLVAMKIVVAHNYYQQPGGEDKVFEAESGLLERYGHEVYRYAVRNNDIKESGKLALAKATVWNAQSYQTLRDLFQQHRPDIVHVHNTLPLISPAIYYAAKAEGVAVVQTLHNYRLLCPAATFFRDNQVCELCLGKAIPWPSIQHGCYRNDRAASTVITTMLSYHRLRRTYIEQVDAYIALTDFAKKKFVEGGLPQEKIHVKAHFLERDPGPGAGEGKYALFVGRLEPEKGIPTLLEAWKDLAGRIPLKIVGDGSLATKVDSATRQLPGVEWLPNVPRERIQELMKAAQVLVFPSVWYEPFGLVIIEAFAAGLPVIASNIGSASVLVEHQRSGLHVGPGNVKELEAQVSWALAHPDVWARMRGQARLEYEKNYTADQNYQQLITIYEAALERNSFKQRP
jgi:glycosyltransferase involved in cell wall biosynthesis